MYVFVCSLIITIVVVVYVFVCVVWVCMGCTQMSFWVAEEGGSDSMQRLS